MIRVDSSETIRDLRRLDHAVQATIRQTLGQSVALAQQLARTSPAFNDRTGRLRESIRRGQRSTWSMFVQAGDRRARYAKFVEDDTKAHEIKPRRKKMLRFVQNGDVRFARRVWHPGTTGKHFMQSARARSEIVLVRFIETGLNHVIG